MRRLIRAVKLEAVRDGNAWRVEGRALERISSGAGSGTRADRSGGETVSAGAWLMGGYRLPVGANRPPPRRQSLKDRLDEERERSASESAVRPIPKYVPGEHPCGGHDRVRGALRGESAARRHAPAGLKDTPTTAPVSH